MGANEESGRCAPVEAEGWRGCRYGAGCTQSVEASPARHADDRPRAALRSRLREDLAALLRTPRAVRGRFRPSVVQADPPRYGSPVTLSRSADSSRAATVAG